MGDQVDEQVWRESVREMNPSFEVIFRGRIMLVSDAVGVGTDECEGATFVFSCSVAGITPASEKGQVILQTLREKARVAV